MSVLLAPALLDALLERFAFSDDLVAAAVRAAARDVGTATADAQARAHANVFRAFADEGVAESDLAGALGYGYDDAARARYESLLARIFGAERALARLSLVSGTHAIVTAIDYHGRALVPANGREMTATSARVASSGSQANGCSGEIRLAAPASANPDYS